MTNKELIPCERLESCRTGIYSQRDCFHYYFKYELSMCRIGEGGLDGTCLGLPCNGFAVEAKKAAKILSDEQNKH